MIALCLDSQNIIGFSELTSNENSRRWIWMCNAFHINGRQLHIYHLWKSIPHSWKSIPKIMSAHAFFWVFRTLQTLNGYDISGQMKWARNSGSKTHVKTQNPTSRTEIRRNSLKYLFLVAGGGNWAKMGVQLLAQTKKAQSVTPQTTKYRYRTVS